MKPLLCLALVLGLASSADARPALASDPVSSRASEQASRPSAVQSGIISHETVVTERLPQRVNPDAVPGVRSESAQQTAPPDSAVRTYSVHSASEVAREPRTAPGSGPRSATQVENSRAVGRLANGVANESVNGGDAPNEVATSKASAVPAVIPVDVYSLSPSAHLLALPSSGRQPSAGRSIRPPAPFYSSDQPTLKPRPLPPEWQVLIREASQIFGLEEGLLEAVIRVESGFDAWAVSSAGAQGAMQIMPHTQIELGLIDPFDPRANIYAGAEYLLRQIQRFGDMQLALAAYNSGPANVEKYGGIPPFAETQQYVKQVMKLWQASK